MVAGAAFILVAPGYRLARPWVIDESRTQWVPGMADGLPYRPPRDVRPSALYRWTPTAPDRIQVYADFHLAPGRAPKMALFLPIVEGEAELFVNGVPTPMSNPAGPHYLTHPASRSMIGEIPTNFLRPGENRIDVVVTGPGRRSLSGPMILGPREAAAALHSTMDRLTGWFRACLPLLSLLAAGLALAAAVARRSSSPWIALGAAAAAIGARTLTSEAGIETALGPFGQVADQVALAAALICLGCALLDPKALRRSRDRWIIRAGLGLFVGLAALSSWGAYRGEAGIAGLGLALPPLALAFMFWGWVDGQDASVPRSGLARALEGWMLGVLALAAVPAVAVGSGIVWGPWILGLETAYGVSVLALLGVLAIRGGSITAVEIWKWARDRPRLSRIITSQREEIEATALALQQQVRRSAVLEERQRLSRDMHDGIGGQLMSLLARVRSRGISPDQLEGELSSGLSELRLMVDSLDASDGSIADALGVLRSRIRTQTDAAGIALDWSQSGDLNVVAEDPRWILNLNRMIQEAATNAVRHAGGDRLKVDIETTGDRHITLTVEDNGVGFDKNRVSPGRGLTNLAFRAAQLGGRLDIERGPSGQGTIVQAVVALPRTLQDHAWPDQSSGDMIPS